MARPLLNTISIETPRGRRIAKDKAAKKIDVIVALAMACVSAVRILWGYRLFPVRAVSSRPQHSLGVTIGSGD